MEAPTSVDLAAAARIAKRVDLKDIRLSEITASGPIKTNGLLEPEVRHACTTRQEGDSLEVLCSYNVRVKSGDVEVVRAEFKYTIIYTLSGDDPVESSDLEHFAFANGTYHSWPFVRQLVFDLTANMGFAPYTLPVFQFNPKPPKREEVAVTEDNVDDPIEDQPED